MLSDYNILVLLMDKATHFWELVLHFFAARSWYSPHYSYSRHRCNGTHRGGGAKLLPVVLLLADSAVRCEDSLRTKRSARAEPADRPAVGFRGDTQRERTRASIPDRQRRDYFFWTTAKVSASVWDTLENECGWRWGGKHWLHLHLLDFCCRELYIFIHKERIQTSTSQNNSKNMVCKSFLFLLKVNCLFVFWLHCIFLFFIFSLPKVLFPPC